MNGATYMNLLDAFAQNAEIKLGAKYLDQFVNDTSFYVDKNFTDLINCYANYFAQEQQNQQEIDNMDYLRWISHKLNDCDLLDLLKQNQRFNDSLI